MKQLVGQMRSWLSKVIVVQFLYLLVFVGEADCIFLIHGVELGASLFSQLFSVVNRLSAASGAAAGTGHDLHEIVAHIAFLKGVYQLSGIAQAAGHGCL